jgi:hypothetical protein
MDSSTFDKEFGSLLITDCTSAINNSSYWVSINRRIMVQAGPGKTQDPISKITKAKMAGEVEAWLKPSKNQALSSAPSTTKYIYVYMYNCIA